MTAIVDRFDRASLGANWESPAVDAAAGALTMLTGEDGVQMEAAKVGVRESSGIYIGEEFNPQYQYAELEILVNYDLEQDPSVYVYPEAVYYLTLNCPTIAQAAGDDRRAVMFLESNLYYPSYGEMHVYMYVKDDANNQYATLNQYLQVEDYFGSDRIPPGAKLRMERILNAYHGYIFSPDRNRWYHIGTIEDDAIEATNYDGYPGAWLYAPTSEETAKFTNFKAGDDLADFLGPTLLGIDMADGTVQTLAADGSTTSVTTIGPLHISVSEGTWGGGTLKFERLNSAGEWKDVVGASYTADFNEVMEFPEGAKNIVRATLTGSTTPDLDVEIQYSGQES